MREHPTRKTRITGAHQTHGGRGTRTAPLAQTVFYATLHTYKLAAISPNMTLKPDPYSQLAALTAMFSPPCLLPSQKRYLWTQPYMVRPALLRKKFGNGRHLLAITPIQHRPRYYLVWIDDKWFGGPDANEELLYENLDAIYETIEDEFGRRNEDAPFQWPEADLGDGTAWWSATADDIASHGVQKRLLAAQPTANTLKEAA